MHHRIRPYVFDFQNWVEKFLLLTSGCVVLLAALYTVFSTKVLLIEILLVATLISSGDSAMWRVAVLPHCHVGS